jgi:glutamate racemase
MKIGVFDSGIGGKSVVNAIEKALPDDKVIFVNDAAHVPYGTKSPQELLKLVIPILNKLSKECDVIVVACNTVTTTIIEKIRVSLPVPLVGMEPMIKPAAEKTKTGVIGVCATPATLASPRYHWLRVTYGKNLKIVEPDCSDWSYMIEHNEVDTKKITECIEQMLKENADIIILGCTHYHWIEELIKGIVAGRAEVLQPEQPVIEQLKKVLAKEYARTRI